MHMNPWKPINIAFLSPCWGLVDHLACVWRSQPKRPTRTHNDEISTPMAPPDPPLASEELLRCCFTQASSAQLSVRAKRYKCLPAVSYAPFCSVSAEQLMCANPAGISAPGSKHDKQKLVYSTGASCGGPPS